MTAPTTLPPAPEARGVVAGWWVTGVKHAARTGHRLTRSTYGGKSYLAVCGRSLHGTPQQLDPGSTLVVCETCRDKADRAAATPDAAPLPPPPSVPRAPAASTAAQENTAAARVARRVAFSAMFIASERAQMYVPRPYGIDEAARLAASLTGGEA